MKIGLPGLLGVVFVVLKLCGVIAWSWLWVTSPFWISFAVWMVVIMGALLLAVVAGGRT